LKHVTSAGIRKVTSTEHQTGSPCGLEALDELDKDQAAYRN